MAIDKLDLLIAAVREIAGERPEVTYPVAGCFYDCGVCTDGTIGCLIGQGLQAIGWKPYEDNEFNGIGSILGREGYDGPKVFWLESAQSRQDGGGCWGDCVEFADEAFGKII